MTWICSRLIRIALGHPFARQAEGSAVLSAGSGQMRIIEVDQLAENQEELR